MKKFILLGELGEKFGREHKFEVKSVAEGIRAFRANYPEFEKYMISSEGRGVGYTIHVNKAPITDEQEILFPLGKQNDIVIAPVILGSSGEAKVILGGLLIVVGALLTFTPAAAASPYIIGIGISLAAGGIIQLLSPLPKLPAPHENEENKPSYYFTGAVNTAAVGEPVPVGYGRMIVGSAVISAGIVVEELD